jgi:hypothetical protein
MPHIAASPSGMVLAGLMAPGRDTAVPAFIEGHRLPRLAAARAGRGFFLAARPERHPMERSGSGSLSLFECLAVVTALLFQLASLLALLQEQTVR